MTSSQESRLGWYARRLGRMSPAELAWRARDRAVQAAWSRRQVSRDGLIEAAAPPAQDRTFTSALPSDTAELVPHEGRAAIVAAADRLLLGEWEVLGHARADLVAPDWFTDPVTGRRSPAERYAFRINHRSEQETGNVKQVWEISRLHHLTLLAMAWYLTGDDRYADRIAAQLRSWWQQNPFLTGVHWTSGIELGIRLISLVWIRRLLDQWAGVADLFERDAVAVQQIRWHQQYLAAFRSRGSSANNHVIAEAAGQLAASCAFDWFPESARWRRSAARLLEVELVRNTFPSGIGRELASEYQAFVAELGLVAAVEASVAGAPLTATATRRLCAMVDSSAAVLDERLRPPRQGDGDEGRALLLDAPERAAGAGLLALGAALYGEQPWWPKVTADARSTVIGALAAGALAAGDRPDQRQSHFADAGLTLLRTSGGQAPEIWCRCDGGPHGYLSIAAHAHADALSVEVRHGGVDVLADPGTYCYHGEPAWRSYFRSTIAHNTAELAGRSQSTEGGPFLWLRHASAHTIRMTDSGEVAEWAAEHDGYTSLHPPARHRRSVLLDRPARTLRIVDEFNGGSHDVRLAFHLGPDVVARLTGDGAELSWPSAPTPGTATFALAPQLEWTLHRGETDPILGWYSAGLGRRVPAYVLIGTGRAVPGTPLTTQLRFDEVNRPDGRADRAKAIYSGASDAPLGVVH
jgi:hypothetical protein